MLFWNFKRIRCFVSVAYISNSIKQSHNRRRSHTWYEEEDHAKCKDIEAAVEAESAGRREDGLHPWESEGEHRGPEEAGGHSLEVWRWQEDHCKNST